MRDWWLERFTVEEIVQIAAAIWSESMVSGSFRVVRIDPIVSYRARRGEGRLKGIWRSIVDCLKYRKALMKRLIMMLLLVALAIPATAFAAAGGVAAATCTPTGFYRDNINLTAAMIGGNVTGTVDATGCDIGVYYGPGTKGSVNKATIKNAKYFGVVNYRGNVDVKNSTITQIGNIPFDGTQHGVGIFYTTEELPYGTASGTTQGLINGNLVEVPEGRNRGSRCKRFGTDPEQHGDRRWRGQLHRAERDSGLVRRHRDREGQHRLRPQLHAGGHRGLRPALLPGRQGRTEEQQPVQQRSGCCVVP